MQPLDILKLLRAHFYDRDVSCGLTGTVLLIQATDTSRSVVPQLQKSSEGNNCINIPPRPTASNHKWYSKNLRPCSAWAFLSFLLYMSLRDWRFLVELQTSVFFEIYDDVTDWISLLIPSSVKMS